MEEEMRPQIVAELPDSLESGVTGQAVVKVEPMVDPAASASDEPDDEDEDDDDEEYSERGGYEPRKPRKTTRIRKRKAEAEFPAQPPVLSNRSRQSLVPFDSQVHPGVQYIMIKKQSFKQGTAQYRCNGCISAQRRFEAARRLTVPTCRMDTRKWCWLGTTPDTTKNEHFCLRFLDPKRRSIAGNHTKQFIRTFLQSEREAAERGEQLRKVRDLYELGIQQLCEQYKHMHSEDELKKVYPTRSAFTSMINRARMQAKKAREGDEQAKQPRVADESADLDSFGGLIGSEMPEPDECPFEPAGQSSIKARPAGWKARNSLVGSNAEMMRVPAQPPALSKLKNASIIPFDSERHPGLQFQFEAKRHNQNGTTLYRCLTCKRTNRRRAAKGLKQLPVSTALLDNKSYCWIGVTPDWPTKPHCCLDTERDSLSKVAALARQHYRRTILEQSQNPLKPSERHAAALESLAQQCDDPETSQQLAALFPDKRTCQRSLGRATRVARRRQQEAPSQPTTAGGIEQSMELDANWAAAPGYESDPADSDDDDDEYMEDGSVGGGASEEGHDEEDSNNVEPTEASETASTSAPEQPAAQSGSAKVKTHIDKIMNACLDAVYDLSGLVPTAEEVQVIGQRLLTGSVLADVLAAELPDNTVFVSQAQAADVVRDCCQRWAVTPEQQPQHQATNTVNVPFIGFAQMKNTSRRVYE